MRRGEAAGTEEGEGSQEREKVLWAMAQHASLRDQSSLTIQKRRSNRTVYILRSGARGSRRGEGVRPARDLRMQTPVGAQWEDGSSLTRPAGRHEHVMARRARRANAPPKVGAGAPVLQAAAILTAPAKATTTGNALGRRFHPFRMVARPAQLVLYVSREGKGGKGLWKHSS